MADQTHRDTQFDEKDVRDLRCVPRIFRDGTSESGTGDTGSMSPYLSNWNVSSFVLLSPVRLSVSGGTSITTLEVRRWVGLGSGKE